MNMIEQEHKKKMDQLELKDRINTLNHEIEMKKIILEGRKLDIEYQHQLNMMKINNQYF